MTLQRRESWWGDFVRLTGGLLAGQIGRIVEEIEPRDADSPMTYRVELTIARRVSHIVLDPRQFERLPSPWHNPQVRVILGPWQGDVGRVIEIVEHTDPERPLSFRVDLEGAGQRIEVLPDEVMPIAPGGMG